MEYSFRLSCEGCSSEGFLDEREGSVRVYAEQDAHDLVNLRTRVSWDRELSTLALWRRGWSMQECILTQRILHFTIGKPIWECNTACHRQCGNSGLHECWKRLNHHLPLSQITKDPEEGVMHISDLPRERPWKGPIGAGNGWLNNTHNVHLRFRKTNWPLCPG
jgi:hypothetical protein